MAKCEAMPENKRKCIVAFDEMSIKESIEFNKKLDFIEGFEDLGPLGRNAKHATHALVFSIKSIYGKWKFPLSYFFTNNSIQKTKLKELLVFNIKSIISIGFLPKAIVCDQGSNNRGALSLLGVSKNKPFFEVEKQKIFAIYDVPHLFKSIRNNWLNGTFKLSHKIFSFNILRQTFEIDRKTNTARALPKITEKHLNPNNFEKMSCSLALQLFSSSMAAAIRSCIATGQLSKAASDTADFISDLNNLFDSLNSRRLFVRNPFNCGISDKNPLVLETLQKGKQIFESLVKVSNSPTKHRDMGDNKPPKKKKRVDSLKESRPPCFEGMVQSINAILSLFESEKNCNSFLLTNKLNQDFLENFFSVIRQRGGWSLNPTAKAFRLSFRIQTVSSILQPSKASNCENDPEISQFLVPFNFTENKSLINSSEIIANTERISIDNSDLDIQDISIENPENPASHKVSLEECATSYYAGYLVRSTQIKFKCQKCLKELTNESEALNDPKQILILNKNYGANVNIFLTVPNKATEHMVEKSMHIFKQQFDKYKEQEFLATKIKNCIIAQNCSWLGSPNDICYEHKRFLIFKMVNTNLFKFCKWTNNNKKENKQKLKNLKNQ